MPRNPGRLACSGRAWQDATRPYRQAWASAGLPCALCGEPINYALRHPHKRSLTVDHRHPIWAGGNPLDPTNWRPAHFACNSSRGASEENANRKARRQPAHTSARW